MQLHGGRGLLATLHEAGSPASPCRGTAPLQYASLFVRPICLARYKLTGTSWNHRPASIIRDACVFDTSDEAWVTSQSSHLFILHRWIPSRLSGLWRGSYS